MCRLKALLTFPGSVKLCFLWTDNCFTVSNVFPEPLQFSLASNKRRSLMVRPQHLRLRWIQIRKLFVPHRSTWIVILVRAALHFVFILCRPFRSKNSLETHFSSANFCRYFHVFIFPTIISCLNFSILCWTRLCVWYSSARGWDATSWKRESIEIYRVSQKKFLIELPRPDLTLATMNRSEVYPFLS